MVNSSPAPSAFPAFLVLAVLGAPLPAQPAVPQTGEGAEAPETAEVHLLARTIQEEVEVIRWHMGRPVEGRSLVPVEGVSIRENFGQAMTLWRKVNQLAVEVVGGGEPPPTVQAPRDEGYGSEHVHQVLASVLDRLEEIKEATGIVGASAIDQDASPLSPNPSATPSDVFQVIIHCNRQVNRMLERQFQPGDVFQRVQQATFYASEILSAAGDPTPFPTTPAYEAGMMSSHVYGRLLEVFDRLAVVFDALGLRMVSWDDEAYVVDESLTASDVYDVATLLLSEIGYLHSLLPEARAPIEVAHPGRRWPSDVYQQAGVLRTQMTQLFALTSENPDLLSIVGAP